MGVDQKLVSDFTKPRRWWRQASRLPRKRPVTRHGSRTLKPLVPGLTFYRWRKQYGGMSRDQLRQLKDLQKENERLRKAVADLTLDKLILTEAARGNF